ncbi:BnaUnng05310D, partial [Brassica napus]
MAHSKPKSDAPFLFPKCEASVLPDPSRFFSNHLLSNPLPTNSFFKNFTLGKGDQPEYFHPYLIKPAKSSLSISYPSLFHNSDFFHEVCKPNITISGSPVVDQSSRQTHQISSFSDLGVNLDFPSSNLRFLLVRGSPFITFSVSCNTITISTSHEFVSFCAKLNNNQTWLIYASSPIKLTKHDNSSIRCRGEFSGLIRMAVLPNSKPDFEPVLDRFSRSYPVSGDADFTKPFTLEYKWEKRGHGDLLMLAHPLHLKLLSKDNESVTVLNNIKYKSIDGDLTGVIGDSSETRLATGRDHLSSHQRRYLIKLFVSRLELVLSLRESDSESGEAGFDRRRVQGSRNAREDHGYGIYNNHHVHLGYFLYAIAVLVKIDPLWGERYRAHAYTLLADYMTFVFFF